MKKMNKYALAFLILLCAFFLGQFFAIGSFQTAGDQMYYAKNKRLIYTVSYQNEDERLDDVYVKIGTVYCPYGENVAVTVKYSTATSSTTGFLAFGEPLVLANGHSKTGVNGGNYNWVAVATDQATVHKKDIRRISFEANKSLQLYEVVGLTDKGNLVYLTAADQSDVKEETLCATYDAQDSFTLSKAARYNFTQSEAYQLTAINTVLGGKTYVEGDVYHLDGNFNVTATLLAIPFVVLFGESTFALRLPSLLATTAILALIYLLGVSLFKSEKWSFLFAALFAFGGFATTVGGLGVPYAVLACCLLAGLYFAYRFYANGISSAKPKRGALNLLFSGMFCAVAVCIEWLAIIPVCGVAVVYAFGLRRQRAAYRLQLSKTEGAEETITNEQGEQRTVNRAAAAAKRSYRYKTRLATLAPVLGFFVFGFLLLLLSGVLAYDGTVKAYDNPADPWRSFASILFSPWLSSGRMSNFTSLQSANSVNVFAWGLPFFSAALYQGVGVKGYLAWGAWTNPVLAILSLAAVLATTVFVVAGFIKKKSDKGTWRVRRAYFVLLGGIILTMLSAAIKGGVTYEASFAFQIFYCGFIPLLLWTAENFLSNRTEQIERPSTEAPESASGGETEPAAKSNKLSRLFTALLWAAVGIAAAVWLISLPATYGFTVPVGVAAIFNWISFISGGI